VGRCLGLGGVVYPDDDHRLPGLLNALDVSDHEGPWCAFPLQSHGFRHEVPTIMIISRQSSGPLRLLILLEIGGGPVDKPELSRSSSLRPSVSPLSPGLHSMTSPARWCRRVVVPERRLSWWSWRWRCCCPLLLLRYECPGSSGHSGRNVQDGDGFESQRSHARGCNQCAGAAHAGARTQRRRSCPRRTRQRAGPQNLEIRLGSIVAVPGVPQKDNHSQKETKPAMSNPSNQVLEAGE
jgi:hypothetical protein